MDARFLGDELERLHPQYTKAPANLIVTQADFRKISLGLRTWRGPVTMVKVLVRRIVSLLRGRQMYAMGNALAIGLRQGLIDAGVPVHYDTELTELLLEDGRVVGRPGADGRRHARGPRPPRRDPRQRRLREEPRDAREVPALPHLGRLDDRLAVQHRRRDPRRHRGRREDRPPRRRLVGADDPAAVGARGSAWPSATCPARSSSTAPASGT